MFGPGSRDVGARLAAERGLLLQSAAYTAARAADRDGMRELTAEAAAIAGRLPGPILPADSLLRRCPELRPAGGDAEEGRGLGLVAVLAAR